MTKAVKQEFSKDKWDEDYRRYQVDLATRYLIPTLTHWGVPFDGKRVLEVGCGDGGCAAAFERAGAQVVMMDVEQRLVDIARELNDREGVHAKAFVGDVFDEAGAFYDEGPFDIVVFRDVMEHLEEPARALQIVARHLSSDGLVFVVFPPYYSPYGAHQQILPRKKLGFLPYNKLPYVQLLPDRSFSAIIRGDAPANREVARLRAGTLESGCAAAITTTHLEHAFAGERHAPLSHRRNEVAGGEIHLVTPVILVPLVL